MPNFLLITVPFFTVDHRYYPAAYVASLIKMSHWDLRYLDLNILIYSACTKSGALTSEWNGENQLGLYDETKLIGQAIIHDALTNKIGQIKPDLIGLSLMNSNRLYAQLVLEVIAKMQLDIPVIYGGPDCFPREYYKDYFGLRFSPDIILKGEAEIALPNFLNEFSETKNIRTSINGFIYKDKNGELVDTGNPGISFLKDEEFLADYSIFNYAETHYLSENKVVTFCSKGCINKCAFCSESRNYGPYRRRKAENVISEIEKNLLEIPDYARANATIVFRDSIFNASTNYIREICELLISKNLNITWFCLGGFRVNLTPDLLDLMYRSGLRSIFYGFESASQRVVDLMGKNYEMRIAEQAICACVERGISVILPIINGFPGEFTRDFLTTLGFILKYRGAVDFGYSNTCGIFKNTPLSEHPGDFCIEQVDEVDYSLRDGYNILPVRQLRQIINDALRKKQKLSESEALREVDFNVLPVAAELSLMVFFLSNYLQRWQQDFKILHPSFVPMGGGAASVDGLNGKYSFLVNIVPGHPLDGWFACDKNKGDFKVGIISLLSELVDALEEKIMAARVDFEEFRNSLYGLHNVKLSKLPPPGFTLLEERFSGYDKGGHVIFEGTLGRLGGSAEISAIEAKCGDYCFDIHHWSEDDSGQKGGGAIRYWGKVSLKMLQKNPLVVCARYSNNTKVCFRMPLSLATPSEEVRADGGLFSSAKNLICRYLPFGLADDRDFDIKK